MIKALLLLALPFLFTGTLDKIKAVFVGKQGASLFQPYFDFIKLMKKGEVISKTTSFVFKIAPSVNLASMVAAALLLTVFHFEGDFILFAYVLALGKFVTVLAAMDTGSSFEGMGAAREVSYTSFVEPSFFIIIPSVCALTGVNSFASISSLFKESVLVAIIAALVLFVMILIEGSRVPVDDPKTHLELTMIHEVMVLDNSGVDLGFINYASALKILLFASLIADILAANSIFMYLTVFLVIAFLIAVIETVGARIRLTHILEYTFILIALALVVTALVMSHLFGGAL